MTSTKAFLDHLHPLAAPGLLAGLIFVVVYTIRKLAPTAWERFASLGPNGLVGKVFQSLPGMAVGAALAAYESGGNPWMAAIGALCGAAASLGHELLKLLPFVPYQGGTTPKG